MAAVAAVAVSWILGMVAHDLGYLWADTSILPHSHLDAPVLWAMGGVVTVVLVDRFRGPRVLATTSPIAVFVLIEALERLIGVEGAVAPFGLLLALLLRIAVGAGITLAFTTFHGPIRRSVVMVLARARTACVSHARAGRTSPARTVCRGPPAPVAR